MATFKDTKGREWTPAINIGTAKRVRNELGVDLVNCVTNGDLQRLGTDLVLMVDVLFLCCAKQAEEQGVTDIDFGESLGGDALSNAGDAFMDALVAFFPTKGQRTVMAAMVAKGRTLGNQAETAMQTVLDRLEAVTVEDLAATSSDDSETSGATSTEPQESPDSTPTA